MGNRKPYHKHKEVIQIDFLNSSKYMYVYGRMTNEVLEVEFLSVFFSGKNDILRGQ